MSTFLSAAVAFLLPEAFSLFGVVRYLVTEFGARANINMFTEYLASGVYGRVEQDPNLNQHPASGRVGNQLRGLYGWPSGDRIV